ncbi:MAG: DMT family transporter [Treponema sp.]|nr:DMT family transporter [Treponema sp.]
MKNENVKRGIALILVSSFGFALMGMFVRAAGDIPFMQKTLFRNTTAFFIALSILLHMRKKDRNALCIPKGALTYLILRSIVGSIGIFGNFYAIDHLNISDAAMLNKMSPFFSLLASFLFLSEKPSVCSIISLITAFSGALFIIKPSFEFTKVLPALVGFAGGAGAGFAYAFVRKLHTYNINGFLIITFFSAFSSLLSLPFFFLNYTPMTSRQVLFLCCAGISAAIGQFGITGAYFNAPSSKISIYEYSQILFSALLGFVAFAQIPDILSIIGYVIIIGTAIIVFVYNTTSSRQKA